MITRTLNDINIIQQSVVWCIQMVLPVPAVCVIGDCHGICGGSGDGISADWSDASDRYPGSDRYPESIRNFRTPAKVAGPDERSAAGESDRGQGDPCISGRKEMKRRG